MRLLSLSEGHIQNFVKYLRNFTAQKMKFSMKDFFSKCDQIRRTMRIWSHLLKKSLTDNFIFYAGTNFKRSSSSMFNWVLNMSKIPDYSPICEALIYEIFTWQTYILQFILIIANWSVCKNTP